jgi:hypothetical protein
MTQEGYIPIIHGDYIVTAKQADEIKQRGNRLKSKIMRGKKLTNKQFNHAFAQSSNGNWEQVIEIKP